MKLDFGFLLGSCRNLKIDCDLRCKTLVLLATALLFNLATMVLVYRHYKG